MVAKSKKTYRHHVVMPENNWSVSPRYKRGVKTYCVAVRNDGFVNSYKIVCDKMTEAEAHKAAKQLDTGYIV